MSTTAYIPIEEFQEVGYLQEANRQFFHPHGLALEMREGFTKESILEYLKQHGVQFGEDAIDCVWTFIHCAGMDKAHLSGVWDYRDDPEGIVYATGPNGINPMDVDKTNRISILRRVKNTIRKARFGWDDGVQPVNDVRMA